MEIIEDESNPNRISKEFLDDNSDVRPLNCELSETVNLVHKKILAIVDSDSDDEVPNKSNDEHNNNKLENKALQASTYQQKRINTTDESDSEQSDGNKHMNSNKLGICDSDSDEDLTKYKSFSSKPSNSKKTKKGISVQKKSGFPGEQIDHDYGLVVSRVSALCDDDSDDSREQISDTVTLNKVDVTKIKKKTAMKTPAPKKITAKQAIEQRQEIKSASQKRLRETSISLPYHKPKARSIKEFLQNRPLLSHSLMNGSIKTPPALALKMSNQELEVVTKRLEERVKAVEQFYMSESDSEGSDSDGREDLQTTKVQETDTVDIIDGDAVHKSDVETQQKITDTSHNTLENKEFEETHVNLTNTYNNVDASKSTSVNFNTELSSNESSIDNCTDEARLVEINSPIEILPKNIDEQMPGNTNLEIIDNVLDIQQNNDNLKDIFTQDTNKINTDFDNNSTDSLLSSLKVVESSKTQILELEDISSTNAFANEINFPQENLSTNKQPQETRHSNEFDFNLDDLEITSNEHPDSNNEDCLQRLLQKYNTSEDNTKPKINKFELLKQVGDFKPRLSGGPNEDIDLQDGNVKPNAISLLMDRFVKHNTIAHKTKGKIQLDVINLSQGELRHETVAMSVGLIEAPIELLETPGSKLKKLRQELQMQIDKERTELWQQKMHNEFNEPSETTIKEIDEKSDDCGANNDEGDEVLEDEEIDYDENEDDEIEEDPKERRTISEFIHSEAEETDADDEYEENETDDMKDEVYKDTNNHESGEIIITKKPLKRIVQVFSDDSDDDDGFAVPKTNITSNVIRTIDDDDDEPIPPNQPRLDITPQKSQLPSQTSLLMPGIIISPLQGLSSESRFLQESPASPHLAPLLENIQRNLFPACATELQPNNKEVDDIAPTVVCEMQCSDIPTTQDLFNICSGGFPQTCSNRKFDEYFDANSPERQNKSLLAEIKNLNEDKLISELLNEEEMELFKKKFESPIEPHVNIMTFTEQNNSDDEVEEVKGGGVLVSDNSDDENIILRNTMSKNLKKKLNFSDEDYSDDEGDSKSDDEEINLHNIADDENNAVEYDSEENEIDSGENELDSEENQINLDQREPKTKLGDFLENEAELSESDWSSADEDEKGLDVLEAEQGDADIFDENEMRNDLGKIHMRRVLDQDTHEIQILQELLLEDGELHGNGRKRQFRWSNIDSENNSELTKNSEFDMYLDEEESEEMWRRARHQREMFFKKKQESQCNIEDDDFISCNSESQLIKLGQEAIRKSLSNSSVPPDDNKSVPTSAESKRPSIFSNTRGSFLARNDQFLNRLAEFTKASTETVLKGSKNSKGFVFHTLVTEDNDYKKRKSDGNTPSIIKKLRLSKNSISPAAVKNRKKLF